MTVKNYNKEGMEQIAYYAESVFPEFKSEMIALMKTLHFTVECSQKVTVDAICRKKGDNFWGEVTF